MTLDLKQILTLFILFLRICLKSLCSGAGNCLASEGWWASAQGGDMSGCIAVAFQGEPLAGVKEFQCGCQASLLTKYCQNGHCWAMCGECSCFSSLWPKAIVFSKARGLSWMEAWCLAWLAPWHPWALLPSCCVPPADPAAGPWGDFLSYTLQWALKMSNIFSKNPHTGEKRILLKHLQLSYGDVSFNLTSQRWFLPDN